MKVDFTKNLTMIGILFLNLIGIIKMNYIYNWLGIVFLLIYLFKIIKINYKVIYVFYHLLYFLFSQIICLSYSMEKRIYSSEIGRHINLNNSAILLILYSFLLLCFIEKIKIPRIKIVLSNQKEIIYLSVCLIISLIYLSFILNNIIPVLNGLDRHDYYKLIQKNQNFYNKFIVIASNSGRYFSAFLLGIYYREKKSKLLVILLLIAVFLQGEKVSGIINCIYYYYYPFILQRSQKKLEIKEVYKYILILIFMSISIIGIIKLNYKLIGDLTLQKVEKKFNDRIAQQGQLFWSVVNELNENSNKEKEVNYRLDKQLMSRYGKKNKVKSFFKNNITFTGFFPTVWVYLFKEILAIPIIFFFLYFWRSWIKFFINFISKKEVNIIVIYYLIVTNHIIISMILGVKFIDLKFIFRNILIIIFLNYILKKMKKINLFRRLK